MTDKLTRASQSEPPLDQDLVYKTEVVSGSETGTPEGLSFPPQRKGSTQVGDQSMLATHSFFEKVTSICQSYKESVAKSPGHRQLREYLVQVAQENQPTLLRNLLEFDVQQRRKSGQAPVPQDYIDVVPEHESLIRRVFLDISSISISGGWKSDAPETQSVDAPIASRLGDYRLLRELGRGGMGAVFEAIHLRRGHRVALKTLPMVSGESLHRFKREFRALADVTHPNLVGLRTLESDGGQWFITLDLIEGCDYLSHVRPNGKLNTDRLNATLGQLAAGLMALHARGIVHRDLKPGNVMVSNVGKVIILDFGLVAELNRAGVVSNTGLVAGTPTYMAPEQAAGEKVGPPADWYAFGVMIYEAISGIRPFTGDTWKILNDKRNTVAPPLEPSPNVNQDLIALTSRLLERDSPSRPDPLEIASVVAMTGSISPLNSGATSAEQLLGRESQFEILRNALSEFRKLASPKTVFIRGRSGEGKTILAESFLEPLRADPSLVVMSGRCYDRESVPFKALDTLIDALASHLRNLPAATAALLLPDDIGLLAEVFPVLRRCDVVEQAPRARIDALNQQQVRQRAFAALRLLLDRISLRTPLVWFIDDLQWGDTDSAGALFEILRPPVAPAVLFLGSFRSDEADTSPFLCEWKAKQELNSVSFGDQMVNVGPLTIEEATQLVVNVVGIDSDTVRRRAIQFHAQAGGNPFLLVELAGCFDPDANAFHTTDIHGVLKRKLEQLPSEAAALLEAVSVSGQSIELAEAVAAAGISESPEQTLTGMRNVRLLRVVGDKVDTYHDRIRYAILDQMSDDARKQMHRQLAQVIEANGNGIGDSEIVSLLSGDQSDTPRRTLPRVYDLAFHYDACGDSHRALAYSFLAAKQARAQFALDVSSQQYLISKRNAGSASSRLRFQIAKGNGEALMQLGRYDESKVELDQAYELSPTDYDAATSMGLQSELALKLGFIEKSIDYSSGALSKLGIRVPKTQFGLWYSLTTETLIQILHSCFPRFIRRGKSNPTIDLANHLLGKLCYAYYCHHVIYLLWASLAGLNRAARLPPSPSLAFNYVVHANDMAVLGWHSRAGQYYRSARELSEELNDQWGAAHALNHNSLGTLGAARFEETIEKATPGTVAFSKLGDLLETHFAHFSIGMSHFGLGQLDQALEKAKWIFDSCVRHGDNVFGPMALCLWARSCRGNFPFDELVGCLGIHPGNNLGVMCVLMSEAYWHIHHERFQSAVDCFQKACCISRENRYLVTYNSWIVSDYAYALRLLIEAKEKYGEKIEKKLIRRWFQVARWANRLSLLLPPERPRALRELAWTYAYRNRLATSSKLLKLSCRKAEEMNAKYEWAKSQYAIGLIAKRQRIDNSEKIISDAEKRVHAIESLTNLG
jgi:eukaryotic-like serine/threonine-protein kinase